MQYLKYRKLLRWLREDPISWSFFFSFFFLFFSFFVIMRYLFEVQKALWSASHEEKKTYKQQQPPASPPHRKNQTPRNHRKSPPRLALKMLIPQPCKETIHRNVQVERPKPFSRLPRTKESFAKAPKHGPEGEDSDCAFHRKPLECGPTLEL